MYKIIKRESDEIIIEMNIIFIIYTNRLNLRLFRVDMQVALNWYLFVFFFHILNKMI